VIRSLFRRRIPSLVSYTVVLAATASGIYLVAFPHAPQRGPFGPMPGRPILPPGSYPLEPLGPGSAVPDLEADGWLNGSPPKAGDPATRLVLLDIWSGW
jgi:hypothetical protein